MIGVDPPLTLFTLVNEQRGHAYGAELTCKYEISESWKLTAWYTYLQLNLQEPPTLAPRTVRVEGSSPHNQAFLMSSWDLGHNWEFDLMFRYVDELPSQFVPSYLSLDLRLGWQPTDCLELSVVGQNLLDSRHLEFGNVGQRPDPLIEIPRGVFGYVTWRY